MKITGYRRNVIKTIPKIKAILTMQPIVASFACNFECYHFREASGSLKAKHKLSKILKTKIM